MISGPGRPNFALRRLTTATLLAAFVLAPSPALAQDFLTKSTARKLGEEGIALFEKKQFAEALEKFNLAEKLLPAPTLGVRAARCLVQLGRFVEASERYLEVTRIEVPQSQMTPAFRKAQAEAIVEREELLALIPSLTIIVQGPLGDEAKVFVDGEQIPTGLIGQKRQMDPGVHEVEIRRKDAMASKKIDLVVKKNEKLTLELPPLPEPPAPEMDPKLRALAWIGMGIGVGGTIAFAVNGSIAVRKQRELAPLCTNGCTPPYHDDVDTLNMLRYATTAGIVAGVVGFGVGIPLLILKPTAGVKKDALAPTWTPLIAPGSIGVRATF